jgi:hypothetical protein
MLNKPMLIAGLVQLQTEMEGKSADAKQYYAEQLADLLESFVKSGEVAAGIPVSTTVSASAQSGATTAPGTIS